MDNTKTTKKVVLNVPDDIHRLIKSEAAKNGMTLHDYCIKVFAEAINR